MASPCKVCPGGFIAQPATTTSTSSKNAPGETLDTPETSLSAVLALHRNWLESAGAKVNDSVEVEIGPTFALYESDVAPRLEPGTTFAESTYLK